MEINFFNHKTYKEISKLILMARICVFTGASDVDDIYKKTARKLGQEIAKRKHQLVYGGSNLGLMGKVSTSARNLGAKVTEIIPSMWINLIQKGDEIVKVKDLRERKEKMLKYSDGFITLPGGIGTLDEFLEIMVEKQIGFHSKPMALLNINDFYSPLLKQLSLLEKEGFLGSKTKSSNNLYEIFTNPSKAMDYIEENLKS